VTDGELGASQGQLRVGGAVAALISGAVALFLTRTTDAASSLAALPILNVLGLGVATAFGAGLARHAVAASPFASVLLAIVLGVAVPALVAAAVVLPVPLLIPIAVFVSPSAWPLTVPAAMGWLALLRWRHTRIRLGTPWLAAAVTGLAVVLVLVRYTQPWVTTSADGRCVGFPGEQVEAIAWSPDGEWLAVGSQRNYTEGVIRLVSATTGDVVELVRRQGVRVYDGLAVAPDSTISYVGDVQAAGSATPQQWGLWEVSAGVPPRLVGVLADVAVRITWTPGGIAGFHEFEWDGSQEPQLSWVRSVDGTIRFDPMTAAEAAAPEVATLGVFVLEPLRVLVNGSVRELPLPADLGGPLALSRDGATLVYQARGLTADNEDVLYDHVVAQSIETGDRTVLLEGQARELSLAGDRLAYVPLSATDGEVCIVAVG
jgi:hypothetical protein